MKNSENSPDDDTQNAVEADNANSETRGSKQDDDETQNAVEVDNANGETGGGKQDGHETQDAVEVDNANIGTDGDKQDTDVFVPDRLTPAQQSGGAMKLALAIVLGVVIVAAGLALFFVNTVTFSSNPPAAQIARTAGFSMVNGNTLYGFGADHEVHISAAGYYDKTVAVSFDEETSSTLLVTLDELPGRITFDLSDYTASSEAANLYIDDVFVSEISQEPVELQRGAVRYRIEHPRYLAATGELDVAGFGAAQTITIDLIPNWRAVTLTSEPSGASVFHEQKLLGQTPLVVDLAPDIYLLTYRKDGFEDENQLLEFELGPDFNADTVSLSANGGILQISSTPTAAQVFVNNVYVGISPLEYPVSAGPEYTITIEKDGYDSWSGAGKAATGQTVSLTANLVRQFGTITVTSDPQAEVYVDGNSFGTTPADVRVPAGDRSVEVRLSGYRAIARTVTVRKGDTKQLDVTLMTLKEARYAEAQPLYRNSVGLNMVLAKPSVFTMGAPRGEKGQMANEVQKQVTLERWFYIAESEVSHRHFSDFLKDLGRIMPDVRMRVPANLDLPVTNIDWNLAALYCNWLSVQEGLPEAYQTQDGALVLDASSIGYRLPTEAEWEWSARVAAQPSAPLSKYPWGRSPTVPRGAGNFADQSAAATIPNRIPKYNDGFSTLAPVKSFGASPMGLYDMGGNVAEWVHDYYGITLQMPGQVLRDPTGPNSGIDHVVKGSSWKSGSETELRFSFRTYSEGPAEHIGFRIGRWVH